MSINRAERRALKKKIAPMAREIAKWEQIALDNPAQKAKAEENIAFIMSKMTLMEMMALQDYIMSKGLLEDNFDNSKNINTNNTKEN